MEKVIETLADAISETPFEDKTYIVGGFVRDRIMGKASNDLDIVVELADGGIKLANYLYEKGLSSKPLLFPRFSTAAIYIDGHKIEFAMTRKEFYKEKSRKPDVNHGSIEDDVFRRDFTINSLLMNVSSGKILDITKHGKSDIEDKLISSTNNPDYIFAEDPLRMLRAVRFAVQLDFKIETKTAKGIHKNSSLMKYISRERQRDELEKILLSPSPTKGINLLFKFKLMK